jgi:hypothetical protein
MIIWFSLLIPCLGALIMVKFFPHKFVWWELFLPTVVTFIVIGVFKLSVETLMVSDTEYNGSLVNKVRYYEAWETWVEQTCRKEYECGTKENPKTCYKEEDCSYCDENSEKYLAYDINGKEYYISSSQYQRLKTEWSNSKFIELNRRINHHWTCGKDGDAYESIWDNKIEHSESNVWTTSYENKTKVSHSTFHYQDISDEQAITLGLYQYPHFFDVYKQQVLLGNFNKYVVNYPTIERKYQYLDSKLGLEKNARFYILLFEDKPLDIALRQEAYWEGGNDNEVIICIGIDSKTKSLTWVKPFSWTSGKRTIVELREEIMALGVLDMDKIYSLIDSSIRTYFIKKDFKEFNYLSVDPPTYEIIITYILALLVTVGVNYWCYTNEHDN